MLEKLAKHHVLWIKMLVNLGCDVEDAKDIVQDMYIRLHKLVKNPDKIMYGDDINRYFVWTTLRNMYFSKLKKDKNNSFYELYDTDDVEQNEFDVAENNAFEEVINRVNEITSKWKVYDKRLFELYFMQGLSLRKISKGANIGLTSIHTSVLRYKKILRDELSEDVMDYFNNDFDRI